MSQELCSGLNNAMMKSLFVSDPETRIQVQITYLKAGPKKH